MCSSGIGNTLFQSAYALSISEKYKVIPIIIYSPQIDKKYKRDCDQAILALKNLNINHKVISQFNVKILLKLIMVVSKIAPHFIEIRKERGLEYDSLMIGSIKSILTVIHSSLCPSINYFKYHNKFLIDWKLNISKLGVSNFLNDNLTTVGLHIRLYEDNSGQVDIRDYLNYFKFAISEINSRHKNLKYIIFSNKKKESINYAIDFGVKNYVFEDELTLNSDFDSLALLASCDILVTSPSTFSWWAAYFKNNHENTYRPDFYNLQ